jgi:hypothetical protein
MPDLNKLVAAHAYWSDKKRVLKAQGAHEASSCEGLDTCGTTCIDRVIEQMRDSNKDNPYDGYDFEETWAVMCGDDEVCQHCKNVRTLKAQRVKASQRLGAVRGAMTRIGRTLEYKGDK